MLPVRPVRPVRVVEPGDRSTDGDAGVGALGAVYPESRPPETGSGGVPNQVSSRSPTTSSGKSPSIQASCPPTKVAATSQRKGRSR